MLTFTTSDPLLSSSQLSSFGFTLSHMVGESLGPLSPPWDDDDLMDFKLDNGLSSVNDIEELLSCSPNSLRLDNEGETDDSSSSFGAGDDASSSSVSTTEEINLKTLSEMFQTESGQNIDNLWTENDEENFPLDPSDPIWDAILEKVNILDGDCEEKQNDLNPWDLLNSREGNTQLCLSGEGQMIPTSCILIEDSLERSLKTFIDQGYCSVCKVCFQSRELLKSHQEEFLRKNVCCQCKKKLDNASKLKNHWRKHNKEKPFQCKWCDKYYSQKNSLVRHQNLYCELAKGKLGQPEISQKVLHSSLKIRLTPEEPHYPCQAVSLQKTRLSFSRSSGLSNMNKAHEPRNPVSSVKLESGTMPINGSQRVETSNTICLICNKNFFDVKSLENHRLHHQSHKSCCSCNKVMASKSKLMIHCRSHTKEFPFTCNVCNRSFAERSTLRKHISTHGEKSFQCDNCGKAFARKDYLTKHSQVHRQLYKCSQCSFQCNDICEIELHLSIHQRVQSDFEGS